MPPTDEILDAVREQAPADVWSRGVTLARAGAVSIDERSVHEVSARVAVVGAPVAPSVTLYLEDAEWDCDCDAAAVACEHVAAVVIACRQGSDKPSEARTIEYRLRRVPGGTFFERGVGGGDRFHVIDVPLDALAAGRFEGPEVAATPDDVAVERALRGNLRGIVTREHAPRVFRALARVERVTLDGKPVRVSGEPRRPTVVVEDVAGGFRVRFDAQSSDVDVLRPEGDVPLSGRELHDLERERVFRADEVGELVGSVLPSLSKHVDLEIRTARLPSSARERPRMALTLRRDGDQLYVLAGIVYGDPPLARVDGGRLVSLGGVVPLRDLDAEEALAKRFANELGVQTGRGVELDTEAAIDFVSSLERYDGYIEGDGRRAFQLRPELVPRLEIRENDLDLDFGGVDVRAVFRAWREGSTLVPLDDFGFAPLPLGWLERYGARVADLLAAREARGELPRSSLPDLAHLCAELDAPPPPGFESLRALVDDFTGLPEAAEASAMKELRDYQRQGVNWLAFLKRAELGALLADDMGLGKTLQALCVLSRRSLVIAPTSVLQNWASEVKRFRPELSVSRFYGSERALDESADITITTHALLRIDREKLSAVDWDTVVIDEAQAIRNPDTELARAAYGLRARFRVSLSGTPIENRLVDLWSQMHFLNPGFLGGLSDFEERYLRSGDPESLARLRERIRPFFLRRLKAEVAPELPPRTELTLRAELDADEREVYDTVRLAARRDVLAKLEKKGNVLAALEALLRLRQAACHPALVPGHEARTSSKTELLLTTLDTAIAEGHKALVFSQWTSMLDLLEPHIEARGFGHLRLDGSTRDRAAIVERFQNDRDVSVFLVSLKAGGVGLNLTAADHVFLFDPWWNPAVEEQAFDRAHRIGQDKPVFVHRLVAADTVEERILRLQEEKRALADVTAGTATLTRDNLLQLLE